MKNRSLYLFAFAILFILSAGSAFAWNPSQPIIPNLSTFPDLSVSTVPPNGDLNPYGVAIVPKGFPLGILQPGDILVSNFNNSLNLQGTGRTIVRITTTGQQSIFFQAPSRNIGLTTGLAVLKAGLVIVGNMPTTNQGGTCTTGPNGQQLGVEPGSLLILSSDGTVVKKKIVSPLIQGPWDLAVKDEGSRVKVFVSNALSGTVIRINLLIGKLRGSVRITVQSITQIASGYRHRCDPTALVLGPTGLALDIARDVLYVASTADNAIFAIPNASTRKSSNRTGSIFILDPVHLHGPLGLVMAPNGDLITTQGDAVNSDPAHLSEIVEYSSIGQFVSQFQLNTLSGSAFGLALSTSSSGFTFAAVDDATNVLDIWRVP